ncbi:MAG: DUF4867 family protein [Treponema sp.]|jgi:hypothetical protein|nr:DUF4867 family protein [Treponema sp.]
MKINSVYSQAFRKFGCILSGYDVSGLMLKLSEKEKPAEGTVYEAGDEDLESLAIAHDFSINAYGGMAVQVGYCNGNNTKLNALEYHRGSEINIPESDIVLLLASLQDVKDNKIDSSKVEAFSIPGHTVVRIYETTLHFAPCNGISKSGISKDGFRVVIVLPLGTNLDKPEITEKNPEDKLLWASNKWLIAHPDSKPAQNGAFAGITGKNIDILHDIK